MDVVAELDCRAGAAAVHAVVADLATYPSWLDIVARCVVAEPAGGESQPAWLIDLRGQLGPLRRTKRLRMVRVLDEPERVRFERRELDGRKHSDWTLSADIAADVSAADAVDAEEIRLTMRLHYGGNLWLPVLDRLLSDESERSAPRLAALGEA